jgi:spore germination protein YaaH
MDLQEYFGAAAGSGSCTIVLDGTIYADEGVEEDGEVYVSADWVRTNLTTRFYYDSETDAVLYTDGSGTWEYKAEQTAVSSDDGRQTTTQKPLVKSIDGKTMLWLKHCLQYADFSASWYLSSEQEDLEGPDRVVIRSGGSENNTATLAKQTAVRYRGGIKSPVLETLQQGTEVTVLGTADEWTEVLTDDGVTGYIKSKYLTDQQTGTVEHTFDGAYSHILMDEKVVLGWLTSNSAVLEGGEDDPASAEELNVVSPTWYTITGTDGSVDDNISEELIIELKSRGLSVWPLISDFTQDVDSKALLSSRASRNALITRLMSDADTYQYDGINLDFEAVTEESAPDFLQFVRELSVECRKRGIILSTDNYVPVSYREYYNYEEQSDYVDYIIMMNYDEHWSTSEPGSVSSRTFFSENLTNALARVDKSQLVCGCPFYTRVYQVKDGTSYGEEAGMQEALDIVEEAGATPVWDEETGQYTASWTSGDTQYYVWLEEERSFTIRMQAVKESDCAGIACWQLGKELPDIWDIIKEGLG